MVSQNSSDYFEEEDSQFLRALGTAILPGDIVVDRDEDDGSDESENLESPQPAQPLKRHYSDIENDQSQMDQVTKDDNDIYGPARFGGFGQYMHRKRAKLQIQNSAIKETVSKGEGSGIFKGLAIYINGWTQPSVQDLRQLIVQHGGIFQPYLDKKSLVTHIITCSLTAAKIREFQNMKVARPEWLVESVKAGELLPWRQFLFVPDERPESSQGSKPKPEGILMSSSVKSLLSATPSGESITATRGVVPPAQMYKADPIRVSGYASAVSNPNAQRAMANPAWRKAHTSVAPDFIEGYYKNSRLHHLATWKAELKDLVHEAQERAENNVNLANTAHLGTIPSEGTSLGTSMRGAELVTKSPPKAKWKGKGKALEDLDRVIMHCDFDCFFVAAGLVSRPELKGKPVVVCHSQGTQGGVSSTSEIASCSYEARGFGIKNGMSLQQARRLCPDIVTIPYEFERYKQFSLQFYTVLMSHADDLQAVSVDEALIDVSAAVSQLRSQVTYQNSSADPAKDYAEMIRDGVRKATSCELSIGISHNILLARLATRKAKPGGSFHLRPEHIEEHLASLEISDLHGFGWQTKKKAEEKLGITALGDLVKKSKGQLIDALGKSTGENLYNAIRGMDDRKLESDKPRKSVSCEINYGIRFENYEQAEDFIRQMATEVKKRLDAINMVGRLVTLKIMKRDPTAPEEPAKFLGHGPCDVFSRQGPLIGPDGKATSDEQIIGDHVWRMLKSFKSPPNDLRGIGIQIQKLEPPNTGSNIPAGQALLPFKTRNPQTNGVGPSKEAVMPVAPFPGDPVKPAVPQKDPFELPSFSQVDKSVLEALPRDIRDELENEYKRRSGSPFVSRTGLGAKPPMRPAPRVTFKNPFPGSRSATPNIFPANPVGGQRNNYKRITQQLAPKTRSALSSTKSSLFALLERGRKKKNPPRVRISDAKLRDLGLDPEVFSALPKRVQDEQLIRARLLKERGTLPSPPAERKVIKAKKLVLPPGFKVWRAPAPRARYPYRPMLRQHGKSKKEKLAFTEASDIQNVLETWVTTYRHWAPREKDVEYLSKFLLQSVNSSMTSGEGVVTAISVMKWWLVLVRRFWPGSELIEEGEPDGSQTDRVGQAWWDTFRGVKAKMDVVARKKFGGSLSLR